MIWCYVDAALHPIRTAVETATLIGDGLNAITNVTFGIATEGARQRNSQRVALYHELKESFINGDSVYRTEMLTELGTSLILGSVSGAAVGRVCSGLSRQSMIAMNQYIVTPQGLAVQQLTIPALYHRARLTYGKEKQIYRIGDSSKGSRGAEGQYWSVKAPDKHHAYRYGVPAKNVQDISNLDIRLAGEIVPNKRFITRHAPGVKDNPGGAIEVVVDSGNVKVTSKTVPIVEQQTPTLLYRGGRQLKNTLISDNTLGVLAVSNHTQESRERFKLL